MQYRNLGKSGLKVSELSKKLNNKPTYEIFKQRKKLNIVSFTEASAWTEDEIIEYLSSGFTPDYDVAGGKMASVVENTSKLSVADRSLIAQYLLRVK